MVARMPAREINDDEQAPEKKELLRPRRPWQSPKVLSIDVASTKIGPPFHPDGPILS
jgi:hypothetical protein